MTRRTLGFHGTARRGFAMFMALGSLVIIGVLVAGSSYITLQETRLGQNSVVQTRAFAAAEYGLNRVQADWDLTPNLTMENGTSFDTNYTVAGQGTAKVRVTRLTNETFWLVSEGRASAGDATSAQRTAVKRVGAILRLRIPTIKANGAITSAGSINIQGSPLVTGANTTPGGWGGCQSPPAADKAGVVLGPDAKLSGNKDPQGSPPSATDPLAADSNTYIRYGDETWNTLKATAITISGGAFGSDIAPVKNAFGSCDRTIKTNWGEPFRSGYDPHKTETLVPECNNYFPIIYSPTSLTLNGKGRGQGILMIEGDLTINGNFDWFGLVVVRDDILKGNGTASIRGAVMARDASVSDNSSVGGNISMYYSQCGLEHAMRGSAQVVQARQRAWAELYD